MKRGVVGELELNIFFLFLVPPRLFFLIKSLTSLLFFNAITANLKPDFDLDVNRLSLCVVAAAWREKPIQILTSDFILKVQICFYLPLLCCAATFPTNHFFVLTGRQEKAMGWFGWGALV